MTVVVAVGTVLNYCYHCHCYPHYTIIVLASIALISNTTIFDVAVVTSLEQQLLYWGRKFTHITVFLATNCYHSSGYYC